MRAAPPAATRIERNRVVVQLLQESAPRFARLDAAHFGDSMNDYDILRFVGHPFVMGNGSYAVKQITQHVIGTNAEHAVQKTMREILESL